MADKNISVLAIVNAREEILDEVRETLVSLVEPTRSEEGCLGYDLHQDSGDPCRFMFYENWVSQEALDKHLDKPYLKNLIGNADSFFSKPLDVSVWKKLPS